MLVPLVCDPARDDDIHVLAAMDATGTLLLTGVGFLIPPLAVHLRLPIRIAFPSTTKRLAGPLS